MRRTGRSNSCVVVVVVERDNVYHACLDKEDDRLGLNKDLQRLLKMTQHTRP